MDAFFEGEHYLIKYKSDFNNKQLDLNQFILLYLSLILGVVKSILECILESEFVIIFILVPILMFLYFLYRVYWDPYLYEKELPDVGFDHIPPGPHRDRKIARAQAARKIGSKMPPPYPNAWFAVAESIDVKIGTVIPVDALGQNLCVYRGEDGVARCVDAYCPHLGANLAVGGSVCGNCIECPFHKWRFDEDGICVSIPEVEHVPKGVSLKKWPTAEANGAIWIWHDADNRDPLWKICDDQELMLHNMRFRARIVNYVNAHVQELPENLADAAHFSIIHDMNLFRGLRNKLPIINKIFGKLVIFPVWSKGEGHVAHVNLPLQYELWNHRKTIVHGTILQKGPGHFSVLVRTPVGPILVVNSVTPIAPMVQKLVRRVFSPWYNAPLAVLSFREDGKQVDRDVSIWNSKRYMATPPFAKTDQTVRAFRHWMAQFYSQNSISFKDAVQKTLDW